MTTLDISALRGRQAQGVKLKDLAAEVGVSWQKLWGLINTQSARPRRRPKATRSPSRPSGPGPLVDRYRPRRLLDIVGQDEIVKQLCMFAANPFPQAFLFEGGTGTGKTTAALCLAAEIGCDVNQNPPEFGGLHVIASGEQTADTIREICNRLWRAPFSGSGWKALIVNEADRMHPAAETIWLDRLEALPPKAVIVFTTNFSGKLSSRFRDRCTRMQFEAQASKLKLDAYGLLSSIWRCEMGTDPDMSVIAQVVDQASEGEQLSFRRAVRLLTPHLGGKS